MGQLHLLNGQKEWQEHGGHEQRHKDGKFRKRKEDSEGFELWSRGRRTAGKRPDLRAVEGGGEDLVKAEGVGGWGEGLRTGWCSQNGARANERGKQGLFLHLRM